MQNILLPEKAENPHHFSQIATLVFALITVVTISRSLAHLLLPDGGANSIATIIYFKFEGIINPNEVIYHLFALWGLAQLAMGIFYLIVLLRYRNLIPLMWLFILFEYVMRLVISNLLKPLGPEYLNGTAPGAVANYLLIPLAVVMIVVSVMSNRRRLT